MTQNDRCSIKVSCSHCSSNYLADKILGLNLATAQEVIKKHTANTMQGKNLNKTKKITMLLLSNYKNNEVVRCTIMHVSPMLMEK